MGKLAFWTFWVTFNATLFVAGWMKQKNDPGLALLNRLKYSVWSSRGAGLNLAVVSALMLLAMCRNLIGVLRNTFLGRIIPFDESVYFHKVCAWTVLLFTVLHTNAHYINFFGVEMVLFDVLKLQAWQVHYGTFGGITGHIMVIVMFFMYTAAAKQMRQQSFETFWFVHHLALVWYICLFFHGYGCFVKTTSGECRPYYSWAYNLLVSVIYVGERILRERRGREYTQIDAAVLHPGNALELCFKKPSLNYKAGQYVFINIPEVSALQWHPFTLTSCPEELVISVHIRLVGDWTRKAARVLGCLDEKRDPRTAQLRVDGPFSAPADRVFGFDYAILVGAGIGATPFLSILKSMYYRFRGADPMMPNAGTMNLKKVDFFWVNREKRAFEWFQHELRGAEGMLPTELLTMHTFLTEKLDLDTIHNYCINADGEVDPITELRSHMQFGRPNWTAEFTKIRARALESTVGGASARGPIRIAVFFCGPTPLARTLRSVCSEVSTSSVEFSFYKEHF